jgi:glycyl-tRNA synthetase
MFKTFMGVTEDTTSVLYLRPETAQGIFIDFMQIQRSMRLKLPFCVCQIGKAFRNEITPGNFIFRTREFEQMEMEYFCKGNESSEIFENELKVIDNFLKNTIGLNSSNLRLKEHDKAELSHYSSRTIDIQYNFPQGFSELWGIANRTNYDLTQHAQESGANLYYVDPITNEKIIPHIIEPSVGADRLFYAIACDKYDTEQLANGESREVFRLPYALAPYKVSVLPLTNKLTEEAKKIFINILDKDISASFDSSGSIGKRYRRQDAIGTPYCVTFDFDSLNDSSVTIRERDSMKQERIKISEIISYITK